MTPEKPPAVMMQETLQTLVATVSTIAEHQQRQAGPDLGLLLADCRDTITEGIGALHSQSADILHGVQLLQAPLATVPPPKYPWWVSGSAGLVAGVVLMGATWWVWPDDGYRSFLVGLDAVLVKHHPQLPAPVQDAVASVYGRYQFQTPGSRQKGK